VATKREPGKKAAPKKRTTKRPARSNSNISAAQKAAAQKRAQQDESTPQADSARKARLASYSKQNEAKASAGSPPLTDPKAQAAKGSVDNRNRETLTKSTLQQNTKSGNSSNDAFKAATGDAQKIAGLLTGIADRHQAEAKAAPPKPGANAADYGQINDKAISTRLVALRNEQIATANRQLKSKGSAVFLGSKKQVIRREQRGGDFEGGQNRVPESIDVDDIRSADELMSWLADEKTFNQIRDAAKKSGIDVQSYDDVAKVWEQVVKQAAATYSTTGKKVTPWALLQLRGKSMVNGKPASKTTTSTSIDEMDPAQAKVMIKNSLQQMLGRDPRQDEIDDFISKAQTIAAQNPQVTTTTTQYDFAGDPVSQQSTSKGGGDVVTAKAQLAAEQAAEDAPDYAQYQAAGVYAPWMFEALSSPI